MLSEDRGGMANLISTFVQSVLWRSTHERGVSFPIPSHWVDRLSSERYLGFHVHDNEGVWQQGRRTRSIHL